MERYQFELLVCAKNDARKRYFNSISKSNQLQNELSQLLSPLDMQNLINAIEVAREKIFVESRNRVVSKFNYLKQNNLNRNYDNNKCTKHVKTPVINLTSTELPKHHESLLYLGPNFVPTSKRIHFMDIISTSECSA